jgi:integration host factor subunit beta
VVSRPLHGQPDALDEPTRRRRPFGQHKGLPVIKAKLIDRIAIASPHLRRSDADWAVNAILEQIIVALARDDRVALRGVGAFTVRVRRGRPGRNPRSGAKVAVPEKRVPYFKPGKPMHDRLNRASVE